MPLQNFTDLLGAHSSLQQQLGSGGISQGQFDAEFNRLKQGNLGEAFRSLDAQVQSGGISQAQAAAEKGRLQGLGFQGLADATRPSAAQNIPTNPIGFAPFTPQNPSAAGSPPFPGFGLIPPTTQGSPPNPLSENRFNAPLFNSLGQTGLEPSVQKAFQDALGVAGLGSPSVDTAAGFFPFGSLGRVSEQPSQQSGRSLADLQEVINLRRGRLGGLSAPENQGLRELGEQGIDRRQQQLLRQSRLGNIAAGRRGLVESASLGPITRESQSAQQDLEKRLIETNLAEKERQLAGLGGAVGTRASAAQQFDRDIFDRQKFNLDRLAAEKQGQLGLLFGIPSFVAQQLANQRAFSLGGRELDILAKQLDLESEQFEAVLEALGGGGGGGFSRPGGGGDGRSDFVLNHETSSGTQFS